MIEFIEILVKAAQQGFNLKFNRRRFLNGFSCQKKKIQLSSWKLHFLKRKNEMKFSPTMMDLVKHVLELPSCSKWNVLRSLILTAHFLVDRRFKGCLLFKYSWHSLRFSINIWFLSFSIYYSWCVLSNITILHAYYNSSNTLTSAYSFYIFFC